MARRKDPDRPSLTPEEALVAALADMSGAGSVLVTAWVGIVEFLDANGDMQLHAHSSNMPSWRAQGIIDAGAEMILDDESVDE